MAIYHDEKKVFNRYHGRQQLLKKYHDSKLVWQFNEICRIPKEYQEVEYLENNSNDFIDLGLKGKYSYTTFIDFQLTSLDRAGFLFGTRGKNTNPNKQTYDTTNAYTIGTWTGTNKVTNFDVWNSWNTTDGVARRYGIDNTLQRMKVTMGWWGVDIDGERVKSNTHYDEDDETVTNLHLFYNPYNSMGQTITGTPILAKVYALTIYDVDGNILRNYVPCYRKSDKVGGMYETVEGAFYRGKDTSKFAYGSDVKCNKLEYIENPNSNFIDLKLKMKSAYTTEIDYQYNKYTVGFLFGSRSTNTDRSKPSSDASFAYSVLLGTTKENFDVCSTFVSANRYQQDYNANRRKVKINKSAVYVNDELKKSFANNSFTTVNSAFMFSCPYCLIGDTKTVGFTDAKIYSLNVKNESNEVILNLKPFQIGDRIGLLDIVSNVFFDGEFVNKPFTTKQSRMI